MRFVSLYSTQLIALAVVVGVAGFLLFTQRRLRPGDRDRRLGALLMLLAATFVGVVIYANATTPFVR